AWSRGPPPRTGPVFDDVELKCGDRIPLRGRPVPPVRDRGRKVAAVVDLRVGVRLPVEVGGRAVPNEVVDPVLRVPVAIRAKGGAGRPRARAVVLRVLFAAS